MAAPTLNCRITLTSPKKNMLVTCSLRQVHTCPCTRQKLASRFAGLSKQGMSNLDLPDYHKISFPDNPPIPLEEIVPDASKEALDLLKHFLVYPSKQRISAKKALLHPYFFTEPLPAHHSELPIPQRTSRRSGLQLKHQAHEYNLDTPISDSLIDPELLAPHVIRMK